MEAATLTNMIATVPRRLAVLDANRSRLKVLEAPPRLILSSLAVIRDKVSNYDWSQLPDIGGWSAGVRVADLKRLVNYWLHSYDWRKVEQHLNQLSNFIADIEGERLHFLHFKGNSSKPPILLLHGWPGSYLEFEGVWGPLVADGHDVVVPSLPGFAFSSPITGVIGPRRAADSRWIYACHTHSVVGMVELYALAPIPQSLNDFFRDIGSARQELEHNRRPVLHWHEAG